MNDKLFLEEPIYRWGWLAAKELAKSGAVLAKKSRGSIKELGPGIGRLSKRIEHGISSGIFRGKRPESCESGSCV